MKIKFCAKPYIKTLSATALALLLGTAVCSAAPLDGIEINDADKTMTVYGTVEGAAQYDPIRIAILKQGETAATLADTYTGADILADFIYLNQIPADQNGGYRVTVDMSGYSSGYYTMRLNGTAFETELYYVTQTDKDALAAQINTICAKEEETALVELATLFDLGETRSDTVSMLGITDPLIYEVDSADLLALVYELVENNMSYDSLQSTVNLALQLTALDEGKADITKCSSFSLDADYLEIYNTKLTDEARERFTEDWFAGKGYDTKSEAETAFCEAVMSAWCNCAESWQDYEEIITGFGDEYGVDMDAYDNLSTARKNKLYTQLLEQGAFSGISDFADMVNDKTKTLVINKVTTGSGSSGGGGGGGSSSGGSSFTAPGVGSVVTPLEPIAVQQPVATPEEPEETFSDMDGYEWATESVERLAEAGVVRGVGENSFAPARQVLREELVTMLLRAYDVEIDSGAKADFNDLDENGWYQADLAAAQAAGLVGGQGDGSFGVGEAVTRQDAAVMAYRFALANGVTFDSAGEDTFADDDEIAGYAAEAVYALKGCGVLNGVGDGRFAPLDTCTRAEAAKMIDTLLNVERG